MGFGGWRGDVAVEVGVGGGVGGEFDELLVVDRGGKERIGVSVVVEGVDVVGGVGVGGGWSGTEGGHDRYLERVMYRESSSRDHGSGEVVDFPEASLIDVLVCDLGPRWGWWKGESETHARRADWWFGKGFSGANGVCTDSRMVMKCSWSGAS